MELEESTCLTSEILQSHSHQDSMVLAQRQKYRSMEQNRKPRDKSTYLWTLYLQQSRQDYAMEKRQIFVISNDFLMMFQSFRGEIIKQKLVCLWQYEGNIRY